MTSEDPSILARIEGRVGRITLNRPKALNSANLDMVSRFVPVFDGWQIDPSVDFLLVDAAGDRAFCAGGDLREIYDAALEGNTELARQFWRVEYALNLAIARASKPYVAIMDGIVMGGGVGLSAHGSHRVVTERTVLAMPECSIGLIPDIGGTHLLANAPGFLGDYLGLTGHRMSGEEAIYAGFADILVASDQLEALKSKLVETGALEVIEDFAQTPSKTALEIHQARIDAAFGKETLEAVFKTLSETQDDWALGTLATLERQSPISMNATFRAIREARQKQNLAEAINLEYRFASRCLEEGDFIEGIRAAVVDKDKNPKWKYARLKDLPQGITDKMLAPALGGDLNLS